MTLFDDSNQVFRKTATAGNVLYTGYSQRIHAMLTGFFCFLLTFLDEESLQVFTFVIKLTDFVRNVYRSTAPIR